MKSTGYFLLDRIQERREQKLNMSILRNVIADEERLSEVSVPSSVRGLAKSHQVARVADNRANAESNAMRIAYVARVGNRSQEQRDKRKGYKEVRRMKAIAEGRIAPLSY